MIQNVHLKTGKSSEKQINTKVWASEYCKRKAQLSNDRQTKGTVFYEVVLFSTDEFTDDYSHIEKNVEEQIENEWGSEFRDTLYNLRLSSLESSLDVILEFTEVDDADAVRKRDNYTIPQSLSNDMKGRRYLGRDFANWVLEFESSVFKDRTDRTRCMVELLEWERDNVEPSHDVARDIVYGTAEYDGIDELHHIVSGDVEFNPNNISMDDLAEWDDAELKARGLGRGPDALEDRTYALECAIENDGLHLSRSEMKQKVMEALNIDTPRHADKYVEEIDVDIKSGVEVTELQLSKLLSDAFESVVPMIDNDSRKGNFVKKGEYGAAGIPRKEFESIEGQYEDSESACEAVLTLRDVETGSMGMTQSYRRKLRKKFFKLVKEELDSS